MLPEQLVKENVVLRRKIVTKPPEPIAPFRVENLAHRRAALWLSQRARIDLALQKCARLSEQIPRAVFFVVTDPDIKVAADPRTRVQRRDLFLRRIRM